MRFTDFLKATVLLSAGAATTLGVLTIAAASNAAEDDVALYAVGWWVAATIVGGGVGRRNEVTPPIGRLLADAKNATMMPEHRPGSVLANRLWALLWAVGAGGGPALRASPPAAAGPTGPRHRHPAPDHLGAGLAPAGVRGAGDRAARRDHVLRGAHVAV